MDDLQAAHRELALAIGEFYDDPLGHVLFSYPWGQGTLTGRTGPQVWQTDFLLEVGEQVRKRGFDGVHPVPPLQMSTASGHGIGKAQPVGVVVETPSGPRQWGTLKPGDYVFGPEGQPVEILAVRWFTERPVYEVTFDDGSTAWVDEEHDWSVKGRRERRGGKGWVTMSTRELVEAGITRSNGQAQARQFEIPRYKPVEYPTANLLLHPYVMGMWLGDGSKGTGSITSADPEVFDKIRALGYDVSANDRNTSSGPAETRTILGIRHLLPECTTYDAAVPAVYLRGDVQQRLNLLHGLMDAAGWVEASSTVMFGSVSEQLARDVLWLARSLGFKARWCGPKPTAYTTPDGERIAGAAFYRVSMQGELPAFSLRRKDECQRVPEERYLKRWISSVELKGYSDTMCIEVARSDGLYLTNDFIVTHNSALTAWLIRWIMDTRPFSKGVVTANTGEQLRTKTWSELAKWHHIGITRAWWVLTSGSGSLSYYHRDHREQWRVDAQTSREENSEAFAGLHAANATPFYIFDEASGVPDKIFEVREGGLTDGEPMTFDFGNPTRNVGRFFRHMEGDLRHRYIRRFIDSREVEQTNKELFERWVHDFGEDSDFVRVRVRGMFPRAGSVQFIPSNLYTDNVMRDVYVGPTAPVVIGVDVARFGDDQSVIWTRHGRDCESRPPQVFRGLDTMQLAAKVVETAKRERADAVFVDGGGVGGGVVDRCVQLGLDVFEVNFGARATKSGYANMRAQMWGEMKAALEDGVRLPDMPDLRMDLTGVEYGYNTRNDIQLESKDDMKKRGLASPDLADALALTYALPVYPSRAGYAGAGDDVAESDYNPLDGA